MGEVEWPLVRDETFGRRGRDAEVKLAVPESEEAIALGKRALEKCPREEEVKWANEEVETKLMKYLKNRRPELHPLQKLGTGTAVYASEGKPQV